MGVEGHIVWAHTELTGIKSEGGALPLAWWTMVDLSGEPVIAQLPWRSAAEADRLLTPRDQRALRALRKTTAEACCPDALDRASLALARLLRAPLGVVTSGDPTPSRRAVGASLRGVATDDALWSRVRTNRLYDPNKLDDFANRPVNTATLARRFPERADAMQEIWHHLNILYQLRIIVAADGAFVGYVGVWRGRRDGAFDLVEHARMAAALPQIGDLLLARHAIGAVNGAGLAAALDAFEQCAFLLLGTTIAYVNRAARARYAGCPEWLRSAASGESHPVHELASVARVDIDGKAYSLVIPRSPPADPAPLSGLTPSLRRVAELMADSRSDKEIAAITGYTLATARTFATRVLARLGLRGRVELVRLVRGR